MRYTCHHVSKWAYANLDLIEEVLEKNSKAVVLIAGASSSGKSYTAKVLKSHLENNGHRACIISLDQYNVGLSGIIPNKVNENFFSGKILCMKEISRRIKEIIYDEPFDGKYRDEIIPKIGDALRDLLSEEDLAKFLPALQEEWARLNFDEPTVYDMAEASEDVKALLREETITLKKYSKVVSERVPCNETVDGKAVDVILVEGIYALDPSLLKLFQGIDIIKDFIDGNPKSLFLRRVIRDQKMTSADNVFTIKAYFQFIVKSYYETIYPSRASADIILNNDMTFEEMREGNLYLTKEEVHFDSKEVYEKILEQADVLETVYQEDVFFVAPKEGVESKNILRLRSLSYDGVNYTPSSLVHKGMPKLRRDQKIIRPINILLREGEFEQVWKDKQKCIDDFFYAGFLIGAIKKKKKVKALLFNCRVTLREVEREGYYLEFNEEPSQELVAFLASLYKLKAE